MDASLPVVYGMLTGSPQMAAAIVGVVVAAVFRAKMPGPALLLLLASLLEMVELARHAAIMGIDTSLAQGIVFGLLVWAVAAGRGRRRPPATPGR